MAIADQVSIVLNGWKLDFLEEYLQEKGANVPSVTDAVDEYRRFVEMTIFSQGRCVPSRVVDEVWHAHILHSKDYVAFSNALGVGYLHHTPAKQQDQNIADQYADTLQFYFERFGKQPNPDVWHLNEAQCNGDCYGHGGCNADAITSTKAYA